MKFSKSTLIKNIALLSAPILVFFVLLVPYSWVNQEFIVDWFGCGCPKLDEAGNLITPDFNANDFTALFWSFISLCTTLVSVFLSKRIPKQVVLLRIVYIVGMLVISLLISYQFCQMMMWK